MPEWTAHLVAYPGHPNYLQAKCPVCDKVVQVRADKTSLYTHNRAKGAQCPISRERINIVATPEPIGERESIAEDFATMRTEEDARGGKAWYLIECDERVSLETKNAAARSARDCKDSATWTQRAAQHAVNAAHVEAATMDAWRDVDADNAAHAAEVTAAYVASRQI